MPKSGKKFLAARAKVESRPYPLPDAVKLVRDVRYAKFDESVDVAMLLGVDPKHADQMVRGTVVLPHGTGKSKRVAVIAGGDKAREAQEAGADHVGAEDLVEKITGGFLEFEALVATPDMMRLVGKLGKVLGPRGLMPSPKTGTVTKDIGQVIGELKKGMVEFRTDRQGVVHTVFGRASFDEASLKDNLRALIRSVAEKKPEEGVKGRYIRKVSIASTMGPGIPLDLNEVTALAEAET